MVTVEVYLNDVWVDITDNVLDSYSQKTILSIEIPKISTLSLKLEGDKAFFDALATVHDVRVYDEGKERFGGYTTGNISIDYTKEDILSGSIKYYDYSKKFYNTLEVLHYENVAICNGVSSLLYLLFDELKNACGLDLTLDCSYIDSSIIDDIYVPEGDIYTNFYDFLSYNALTMYIIGKTIYIYDLLSVPTESYILEDVASLKESYSFDRDNSNPLVYASRVTTQEDERIFTLNDSDEGEVLINGDSYPIVEDDDDAEYLTCQYDIELEDNEELIAVTDVVTTQVLDYADSIDADIDMGQESADIKLTNNTGSFVVFNNLYLDATLQVQEYFQSSSLESGATEEVKTVFLRDTDHVTRYLRYVSFINGYNKKYYTFYSDSEMEVGDMVSVRDLTDPLIITQRTDSQDKFGGYDYIATLYQNTVVDAITKKIAVSKYEKGYTGDIYSSDGFVLDGDFETTLTCKVFLNTKEMSPSTYQWIRESGNTELDNAWKVGKNSKTLDITQDDLRGLGSVQFSCKTTYPNFLTDYKQVVDLSKSTTEKLTIEYATSSSSTLVGSAQLGTFQGEYFQFKGEDIQVFNGVVWTTEQPTSTDVYVFIRYTDNTTGTQTVSLYSIPLEKSISLVASSNGIFSVTERGVVNNETISITIKPTNFYILDGDINTTWYYYDSEWLLLTGNESTIAIDYDSFTFPLTVKTVYDLGSETIEDTIELTEITQSVSTAHYSVLSTEPTNMGTTAPVGFDEYGTKYIKGDSYVYERTNEDDSVDYIPYVFDGTDWIETTDENGNVESQYIDILSQCATSVVNEGKDIPTSSSAIYGYFKNLIATNAVVDNLLAKNIQAGSGDDTTGFRFRARTHEDGTELTTPIFDIMYNGTTVFSVDASLGNVNFGDDGSGNPLFYYEQSSKTIKSKDEKVVINSDGTFKATDGDFTGTINATNGFFKGYFDTTALKLQAGTTNIVDLGTFTGTHATDNLYNSFVSNNFEDNTIYTCNFKVDGANSIAKYFHASSYEQGSPSSLYYSFLFLDENKETVYELRGSEKGSSYLRRKTTNIHFTTINLIVYSGGDILKVSSEIPLTSNGLEDYQLYLDGDTLKAKLPS